MVNLCALVVLVSTLAAFAAPPVNSPKADAAITAINVVSMKVGVLDEHLKAFPTSPTLKGVFVIHTDTSNVLVALGQATAAVQAVDVVTIAVALVILKTINTNLPVILDALNRIASSKAAFREVPLTGVTKGVKHDLMDLAMANNAFASAILTACPASLKPQAIAINKDIDAGVSKAMAAYANE